VPCGLWRKALCKENSAKASWVGEELFCWDEATPHVQPRWLRHRHLIHKAVRHKQERVAVNLLNVIYTEPEKICIGSRKNSA
jgi:hypothetical protein